MIVDSQCRYAIKLIQWYVTSRVNLAGITSSTDPFPRALPSGWPTTNEKEWFWMVDSATNHPYFHHGWWSILSKSWGGGGFQSWISPTQIEYWWLEMPWFALPLLLHKHLAQPCLSDSKSGRIVPSGKAEICSHHTWGTPNHPKMTSSRWERNNILIDWL